jgi:hypothetical protein
MTKEISIKKLEKEAIERANFDKNALQLEIVNLKKVLEQKLLIIEDLRNKTGHDLCADHDSDDDLTKGTCTKTKLKRRVFKKIEHLNDYIRKEVEPEIHARYTIEIERLMKQQHEELMNQGTKFNANLHNQKTEYELKLS